ncbi:NADP-dependent oxidoreductase [Streptomyces sp. NPDC049813]|uniref:NADP-dependent oxidoreductase n=1 Tax=Streptomyces sp. NPDC049813 TaxID=3365597 RepID=UPI00378DE138
MGNEQNEAATMKAITYEKYGDRDVLSLTDQPLPKVGPGEALVRVRYAAVNPVDWKVMSGGLDAMMDTVFPVIPGWDVSGVVERVGIDAPEFTAGDEVFSYARKDYVHGGTFAEFVTVPVRALVAKPPSLSFGEAAGVPLAGLTAYQSLTRLDTGGSDTVLIHNAAGGVGTFGVQIAKALGARVIATASESNHDRLRALGAEPVSYGDGVTDRIKELAPDGVDVVVDYVGGVLDVTRAVLREGGRHASIADPDVVKEGGQWMWARPDADGLRALADLAEKGQLRVPVAETFPLERVADAFELSQSGHVHGKILIQVADA